jgi:hypothetical protein
MTAMTTTRLLNVGRKLQARMRDFFDAAPDATAPPLELLQATLDQLERKVQPGGRGTRTFPYNRIVVHVAQPNADRTALEAVFAQLPTRLRERLTELRCDTPPDLQSSLTLEEPTLPASTDSATANGNVNPRPVLWLECSSTEDARSRTPLLTTAAPDSNEPARLRVTVVTGQCEQPEYTFEDEAAQGVIAIGRGADPADSYGRMRHNHIAFVETRDGATETVARAHARLEFDPTSRTYLLFNESTSNPTFIRRGGRSLRIPPRDPRGVRIQSGDELQLGRAVLKLNL